MNFTVFDREYIQKELQNNDQIGKRSFFNLGEYNARERLGFQNGRFVDQSFDLIANNRHVSFFGIHNCEGISDDDLRFLGSLPLLREVYVSSSNLDCSFLRFLNKRIKRIDIWFSLFSPKNYIHLKHLNQLEEITIVGSEVEEELFDFVNPKRLHNLRIEHNTFKSDSETTRRFNFLEYVELRNCSGIGYVLPRIADSFKYLTNLYLTNSDIDDSVFIKTTSCGLSSLEVIDLSLTQITDKSLECLKDNASLCLLYLNGASVSMRGIEQLHSAKFRETLSHLEMIDTIPPYDLGVFVDMFPKLRRLTLRFSDVDQEQLKRMGWILKSEGKHTAYFTHPKYFNIEYYKTAYADEWKMLSSPKRLMKEPQVSFI